MKTPLELIKERIEEHKKVCYEWYKDYLHEGLDVPEEDLITPDDVSYEMSEIEPFGDDEDLMYSAGYLQGLKEAERLLASVYESQVAHALQVECSL